MIYPGYLLNPGDMFSVEPDMVLFATGKHKGELTYNPYRSPEEKAKQEEEPEEEAAEEDYEVEAEQELASTEQVDDIVEDPTVASKKALMKLRRVIKELEAKEKDNLSGKKKQELRLLKKEASRLISKPHKLDSDLVEAFQTQLDRLADSVAERKSATETLAAASSPAQPASPAAEAPAVVRTHADALQAALQSNKFNPLKTYLTPWEPRPFMSAFAFIPRYLEVNHNICSAVYLRHPVARRGISEVPTPFPLDVSQLAHAWYLRRR